MVLCVCQGLRVWLLLIIWLEKEVHPQSATYISNNIEKKRVLNGWNGSEGGLDCDCLMASTGVVWIKIQPKNCEYSDLKEKFWEKFWLEKFEISGISWIYYKECRFWV